MISCMLVTKTTILESTPLHIHVHVHPKVTNIVLYHYVQYSYSECPTQVRSPEELVTDSDEECDPEVTKVEETDLREDEEILKDENLKVVHKTTKYM